MGERTFNLALGEMVAMCKLIALWKDNEQTDVRPVGVGGALRRLLCRTYTGQVREQLKHLVGEHQLGALKAGYEKGIHSLRALIPQCEKEGLVTLLLDFRNAYNTTDRNLMLRLAASDLPEIAKLSQWLYQNESDLVTASG